MIKIDKSDTINRLCKSSATDLKNMVYYSLKLALEPI
jgi:hypothetical protein